MLAADLVISEFLASNNNVFVDDYGRSSDWIEIYNAGDTTADLTGHRLTDDVGDTSKWFFPSGTMLGANEFLVVFAEDDFDTSDSFELYTGFRLSAGGEYIGLYDSAGAVLSEFGTGGTDFPAQQTDVSYGFAFDTPVSTTPIPEILIDAVQGNGSFEDLTGASPNLGGNRIGGTNDGAIPGWTSNRILGFTGWDDDNFAAEGVEYAFVNNEARAIFESSAIATTFLEGETLDLSFESITNAIGSSVEFRVSLLFDTGGNVTFSPLTYSELDGQYETQSFQHVITAAQANATTVAVQIDVDNTGGGVADQPRFDNVQLLKTSVPAVELIASGANARVLVPANNSVDNVWRNPGFDDSGWFLGPTPFGYENAPNNNAASFEDLFRANSSASDDDPDDLYNGTDLNDAGLTGSDNTPETFYVRYAFEIEDVTRVTNLLLDLQYEDGFIAYLNGDNVVAQVNAPANPQFDSTTLGNATHADPDALQFVEFSLLNDLDKLVDGTNVLAIHVLNGGTNSSDMLLNARLSAQMLPAGDIWRNLENFDDVTAPGLPAGWTASASPLNPWQTSNTGAFSGTNRAVVTNPPSVTDSQLTSPLISVTAETSKVRFQNFYNTEQDWDGGILEISIAGGVYEEITTAGGSFVSGGYNLTLQNSGSVLSGQNAWSGNSGGYIQTVVDLPAAAIDQDIQLRWRFASDQAVAGLDWSIDSIEQVLTIPENPNSGGDGPTLREPREFGFLQTPTPGAANTDLRASGVLFSRDSGLFTSAFSLTLTPEVPGEEIRFTLDGSVPGATSPLFTGPINISGSTEVRAIAVAAGGQLGVVFGETYELIDSGLASFTSNLPILVLDNYGAGNPLNRSFNTTFFATFEPDPTTGLTSFNSEATVTSRSATHRRGSSSFSLGKNNFRLELRDQTDDDQSRSLLGLPAESDFILNTFARFDRAQVRNPIAFDTNRQVGVYAPNYRYVEVFFNQDGDSLEASDYFGTYILQETIKRDGNRVDIADLDPTDDTPTTDLLGDAPITGGYIIAGDRNQAGDPAFDTTRNFPSTERFIVETPNSLTANQFNYIRDYFNATEEAIFGTDFRDSQGRSYEEFIDVDSFIEQHIFQAFWKGPDALRFSTYFYKDRGGKLTAGPNWDQERIGGVETDTGTNRSRNPENWYGDPDDPNNPTAFITEIFEHDWWDRLFDDPNFQQRWIDRWEEFRVGIYNDANITSLLDSYQAQLLGSDPLNSPLVRNFIRWGDDASNGSGGNNNNGGEAWPNARVPTSTDPSSNGFYQFADPSITSGVTDPAISPTPENILAYWRSEISHLGNWIEARIDWVYDQLSDVADFTVAEGVVTPGTQVNFVIPASVSGSAEVYYTTDGSDPRDSTDGNKGNPSPSAILWTGGPITINATTQLTVRILDSTIQNPKNQVNGQANTFDIWSAPSSALFETGVTVQDALRITEINYNPHAPTAAELNAILGVEADDFQFLEIQNVSTTGSLNLNGTRFADGVTFAFGNVTLAPGERAVVVEDATAFELRYGTGLNVVGQWSGRLSGNGEKIAVLNNLNQEVMEITYNNADPWPVAADAAGGTLVLDDPAGTPADQLGKYYRWRSSSEFGGTPGAPDAELNGIVINEILAHTDLPEIDAIELHNPTGRAINIGGWFLSDSRGTLLKYEIPAGTMLGSGQYLVFDESDFNPTPATPGPNDFALSALGDQVYLTIPDGSGGVEAFVDAVDFDATFNDESVGRVPDGAGRLAPLTVTTLGTANTNSLPRIGELIISEVNYHPADPTTAAQNAYQAIAGGAAEPLIDNDLEFIEVYNPTNTSISLTNWQLRGESDFDFASGTMLDSEASLVVVSFDPATDAARVAGFRTHYGIGSEVTLVGAFSANLSNGFARVELEQPDPTDTVNNPGVTSDEVLYDDLAPWDTDADGFGESLNRISATSYGNASTSWNGAIPTPGSVNFVTENADFNGDSIVDGADFLFWQRGFGISGSATLADGDANSDTNVNGADFSVWQSQYGSSGTATILSQLGSQSETAEFLSQTPSEPASSEQALLDLRLFYRIAEPEVSDLVFEEIAVEAVAVQHHIPHDILSHNSKDRSTADAALEDLFDSELEDEIQAAPKKFVFHSEFTTA